MRLALGICVALVTACSEEGNLAPIADGGDGTSEGSGSATAGDGQDTPDDGATDAVDASDSDGGTTEGPGDPTLCWEVSDLGVGVAAFEGAAVYDSDGDGSDELWVWDIATDLSSTDLQRLSLDGDEVETLTGAFVALVDYDGDGVRDALMRDGPGVLSLYRGTGTGFEAAAAAVDYPGGEFVGAFDVDGDGNDDLLLRATTVSLELALGDGTGIFVGGLTLGVPAQERMEAYPMAGAPDRFVLRSQPSPGTRGCDVNRLDTIAYDGALAISATGPMDQWDPPLAVLDISGEGNPDAVVVACDTIPSITTLRLLQDAGEGGITESTVVDDAQWAMPGDVDGDGALDVVWGEAPGGAMLVRLDFAGSDVAETTGVEAGTVVDNAVWAGDLDGQGRAEILRATTRGDQTAFERIATVDCG